MGIRVEIHESKDDSCERAIGCVLFWDAGVAVRSRNSNGQMAIITFLMSSLENQSEFGTPRVLEEDKSQAEEQKWERRKPGGREIASIPRPMHMREIKLQGKSQSGI